MVKRMAQLHQRHRKVQVRSLYRVISKLVEAVSSWMNISCRTWSGGLMLALVHVGVKKWSRWHWHWHRHHMLFFQHMCLVLLSCTMTLPILAGHPHTHHQHYLGLLLPTSERFGWCFYIKKCIHIAIVTETACRVRADWFKVFFSFTSIWQNSI